MLIANYPLSDQDQQKLINDGWTLYLNSIEHKLVFRIDKEEGASEFTMPTKAAIKRHAENTAYMAKICVATDLYGLRKETLSQLIDRGYKLIRREKHTGLIKYYHLLSGTKEGSWRKLARVGHKEMEPYMARELNDSKTLEI
mgnify:FL=1